MQLSSPTGACQRQLGSTVSPYLFLAFVAIALYFGLRRAACHTETAPPLGIVLPPPAEKTMEPTTEKEEEPTMQGGLSQYRFDEPEKTWELPVELTEVSGIAFTGPTTLALIQDERGSLYRLGLGNGGDIDRVKFGPKADYEGLARASERLVVLRSDGALLELDLQGQARGHFTEPLKDLPNKEFESIAFEPTQKRWIVLPKDTVSEGDLKKDERVIYGLGLEDFALAPDPVLVLSRKEIVKDAASRDWPLPTRRNKKGKEKSDFNFHPSDLAVHPITGDYFIVSGSDRTLIAVSPAGELLGTATFPRSLLEQPEGLAFQPNGDLLIASEGAGRPAVLVRFLFKAE